MRALAVIAIVAVITLCAFFSLSAHSNSDVRANDPDVDVTTHSLDRDATDDAQGSIDLFGNDVTDAVARYRFDATGSLYEVHSPQTEIPKLGSPKT